jgi:hypothetical protein
MKKTIITSTLALGLGATGLVAGHSANAAENNVDHAKLAQQAQSNSNQLNESPVQKGSYNYNFTQDGTNYNFKSDGTNYTWSYNGYNNGSQDSSNQAQQSSNSGQQQAQSQKEQPQQAQPQKEQAQQQSQSQEAQPQQSKQSTSSDESKSSDASSSSSDVNGHLKQIAQRESGGDTKAVNPSTGAAGKYQFLQTTWDSVAPSEYQGKSPTEAPESVQDQAAQKLYDTEGASQWVTA